MTTALLIAIIDASPVLIAALERLFASFHAAGHPDTALHTPPQVAQIEAVVAEHNPSYVPTTLISDGPQTFENPDGGE